MDQKTLWQAYRSLPDEAQHQLTDFIAFLRTKYRLPTMAEPNEVVFDQDPFVGMWQGRADLTESTARVRERRRQEWHDRSA